MHALGEADVTVRFEAATLRNHVPTMAALAEAGHAPALQYLLSAPAYEASARAVLGTWIERGVAGATGQYRVLIAALERLPVYGAEAALVRMVGGLSGAGDPGAGQGCRGGSADAVGGTRRRAHAE